MKTDSFTASLTLLPLWLALLACNPLSAQTIVTQNASLNYAPTDIFNWNLSNNTITQQPNPNAVYDQVISGGKNHKLTIETGATFNIIFGSGVDLSNTFWDASKQWVVFDLFNPSTTQQFTLGSITGGLNNYTLADNRPGTSFTVTATASGQVFLDYLNPDSVSFIPEPSTLLAGLLLTAGLLRRSRGRELEVIG